MPDAARLTKVAGREQWHVYDERKRISTGHTDRALALRFLADYVAGRVAPVSPAATTVEATLAAYLVTRARKPGAERLRWAHQPLRRHLGAQLAEHADPVPYAAARAAEGVRPSTVRTELQALRAALKWAKIGTPVPLPSRPEPRQRWLTRAEGERLLTACKARHLRLFVTLALNTAARSGAILGLTWDRVDLVQRTLDYRDPALTVTKKRRVPVPINNTLLTALTEAKARATSPYVVEWSGGRVASVKHGFHSASVTAGIEGASPHTLRHTAVTWMMQRGVPLWQVAGMAGMTVDMVQSTYGHHHSEFMADAAKALG